MPLTYPTYSHNVIHNIWLGSVDNNVEPYIVLNTVLAITLEFISIFS